MKNHNKNKSLSWLMEESITNNIVVDAKIMDANYVVRGIYGIFVIDNEEKCVYVGRASNLYDRMFGSNGHITNLRKNKHTNQQLKDAIERRKQIIIKLLQEVPYMFDNYYKDMQRLSSEENKFIDQYQAINQCLEQVPEGTRMPKNTWYEKRYK